MEETARRFPDLPTVHGMLGAAFLEHGVRERARREFERELEVMPYDTIAASHLVRIYEEEKDPKKVDALLEKLHERWKALWQRFPGFGPVAVTYARTLADGGRDVDGARGVLRKSLEAACRPVDRKMIEAALAELR